MKVLWHVNKGNELELLLFKGAVKALRKPRLPCIVGQQWQPVVARKRQQMRVSRDVKMPNLFPKQRFFHGAKSICRSTGGKPPVAHINSATRRGR